ncbi:ATP-binding cassette domain-containing protein [Sedimentibacter sp. zth1]|uniref:oligopeptide/dipeptide ABC transporter ATP-binding protein n=1 Tax=Sedimentibacter sp. zth1 TaxID=2816908 RepID=UPI001A9116C6|nr:oligopeptide/dipeptide ABC transporter ATP-binding protein [Sedimentibacter sp. zth1]QSX04719.1 ATP-binding cassette domain-containing protein [Sedimentibacter sp. zth1]
MEDRKVLVGISEMKKYFPVKKTKLFQKERLNVKANDGITLDIFEGETVGLVGESGCGKSTFGRVLLQLYPQTSGRTMYYGRTIEEFHPKYIEELLKNIKHEIHKHHMLEEERLKLEDDIKKSPNNYDVIYNLQEKRKKSKELFLDITNIIGGFIIDEDVEKVAKYFLEEYRAKLQIVKLKNSLDTAKQKELVKLNRQLDEQKEIINLNRKLINEEKRRFDKNPKFDEYEKNLDIGINLAKLEYNEIRVLRKDLQIIFQDPYSSLNPKMTVGQIIGEGLMAHGFFKKNDDKMQNYVMNVMEDCGLSGYMLHRYPHQFSGGQRQRIGIARALALKPKFVVCDEAVSALDVSIQSQIINLLLDLKEKEELTYLFISHDLSVVKYISDRIGVMYLGNIVELADTEQIFSNPLHPYTEALMSAIPTTDNKLEEAILLEGDIPSPIKPPKGCKFHTRCPKCMDICKKVTPEFIEYEEGHFVACHLRTK